MLHLGSPCLTAIEKSAEHTGLVDTQSGLLSQAGVVPDSIAMNAPVFHLFRTEIQNELLGFRINISNN